MLIAHLNKRYWPHVGGIERFVCDLASATVAVGDPVTAYVCAPGPRPSRDVSGGVEVLGAPTFGVVSSQPLAPTYPLLPREDGAIWHLHEPFPLGTLTAALRARGRRRLIVTWHSDVIRQRRLRPLHSFLVRRVLRAADAIHVPTRAHLERSEMLRPFSDKVRVIPFLVDLRRVAAPPGHPLAARVRAFAAGGPVVLAVGRLVYYKGVDVLLEALAATSAPRLVIVGDGPLRPRLEALAARLGIGSRVLWLGTVSDADLAAAYSASDVFVLSSVAPSEAFGIVQVEAMAAGLPVVSTRLGTGVEEVNRDGETGLLVRPGASGDLVAALERLLGDEPLRRRLGAQAREHAQTFSPERLLPRYRELYAEVAARPR